jgi:hypothetical protein
LQWTERRFLFRIVVSWSYRFGTDEAMALWSDTSQTLKGVIHRVRNNGKPEIGFIGRSFRTPVSCTVARKEITTQEVSDPRP